MKRTHFLYLLCALSLLSCGREKSKVRVSCEPAQWLTCDTILLEEDSVALLGTIKDFIVRDSVILLTDGVSLNLYNHEGMLLKRFGSQGHASSEYIAISKLYATDHHIYAWCGMSQQLLQYSWEGEFENKYPGLSEGIYHFCVQGDSMVHYYQAGRSSLMAGQSLTSGQVIYQTEDFLPEDYYLFPYEGSGGMAMMGDACLFVHASDMVIRRIKDGQSEPVLEIKDKEFKVSPAQKRPMTPHELMEYIPQNSTSRGLFSDGSGLYLTAETGQFALEQGVTDFSKRFLHVIRLDSAFHLEKANCYPYPFWLMRYRIHRQCLYGITTADDRGIVLKYQL